jgi:hypothetical protein
MSSPKVIFFYRWEISRLVVIMRSSLDLKGFLFVYYYLTCISLFHNFIIMNISSNGNLVR